MERREIKRTIVNKSERREKRRKKEDEQKRARMRQTKSENGETDRKR